MSDLKIVHCANCVYCDVGQDYEDEYINQYGVCVKRNKFVNFDVGRICDLFEESE